MNNADKKTTKLYYSTKEVAQILDIAESNVRFWEKEFDISPKRTQKGNRQYTQKEIDSFLLIKHMLKDKRLTLEGAKAKLKKNCTDEETNSVVVQKLKTLSEQLKAIRNEL